MIPTARSHHRSRPSQRCAHGVTLIELMVSMAIGLVLLTGLTVLFSSTSMSFRVQDAFARLQENGTAALRYLSDDIRMAGFYGESTSAASVKLDNLPSIAAADDCGAELPGPPARPYALDLAVPIEVYGAGDLTPATVSSTFPCIAADNFSPGSPVIVLRGATGQVIDQPDANGNMSAALAAQPNYDKTLYVQSSPTQDPNTIVFRGDNYAALRDASPGNVRMLASNKDAPIFAYQAHVYYLRPCSRPTGGSAEKPICRADDDGGRPIPTLVRQEISSTAATVRMQEVSLVEGIERLNFSYGLDANGDGIPDRYSAAPSVSEWPQVISVRITALVRSVDPIMGQNDAGKRYDLGGGASFSCSGSDCTYLRQIYSQTVQLRDCAARRSTGGQQC
ncbi:MAG TPA: PilW family protein [Rhodocyclaceae bacterium]|nr:PilW family protein [Rhodocyclaceae bacterium]